MNENRGIWRGKGVNNWHYGDLIRAGSENNHSPIIIENGARYDVFLETLGECTGLTDKNGKLIFEGDIVSAYYCPKEKTAIGTVRFGDFMDVDSLDTYGYLGWYIEVQGHCISILQPKSDGICIEVIGNIHDNPELMNATGEDIGNAAQDTLAPAT